MRWKVSVLLGILLYVLIFVEISVLMFVPALQNKPAMQTIIHLIILPFLVLICGYIYFRGKKGTLKEGLLFGIALLAVGTILDWIITIPLFIMPKGQAFFDFYKTWSIWAGFAEVLALSAISGMIFGIKAKKKK